MQIVIDIPEDYYKAIKEIPVEQSTADMMIIRNGTPQQKTGHWKDIDNNRVECSECGHKECSERFTFEDINYCTRCGAKME